MLAWGDQLDWLEAIALEEGAPPKALLGRPILREHLRFEWSAFWVLLNDRPAGKSGRIPFMAIDRYAERYGIDTLDRFERFQTLIAAMNTAFNEAVSSAGEPSTSDDEPS